MPSFLLWTGAGDWLESCYAWVKACSQGGPDVSAVACASACFVLWRQTASATDILGPLVVTGSPTFVYLLGFLFCFSLFKLVKQEYNKKISI